MGADTKKDINSHLIWLPKYRKQVLTGLVAIRTAMCWGRRKVDLKSTAYKTPRPMVEGCLVCSVLEAGPGSPWTCLMNCCDEGRLNISVPCYSVLFQQRRQIAWADRSDGGSHMLKKIPWKDVFKLLPGAFFVSARIQLYLYLVCWTL
jgi:hypothetical protein